MRIAWFVALTLCLVLVESKRRNKKQPNTGGGDRSHENLIIEGTDNGPPMGPMHPPDEAQSPGTFEQKAMIKMRSILGRILGASMNRYDDQVEDFKSEFWTTLASAREVMAWIQGHGNDRAPNTGTSEENPHNGPPPHPSNHSDPSAPWGVREEPPYTVVCTSLSGYELRRYPTATWVSTIVDTRSFDAATIVGFKRLIMYLKGYNSQNRTIPMTSPVRTSVSTSKRSIAKTSLLRNAEKFKISFYLPADLHEAPPTPRDKMLIIERNAHYVYALNFTGFAHGVSSYDTYSKLKNLLDEASQSYDRHQLYVNVFNPPWITINRRNEILISAIVDLSSTLCPGEAPEPGFPNGIRQCARTECPVSSLDDHLTSSIISRRFEGGVYATKQVTTCDMVLNRKEPYRALNKYFKGDNNQNQRMDRTTPLYVTRRRAEESDCGSAYEMSFYLPKAYHSNPPIPDDNTVKISSTEPSYHYVLTFEGSNPNMTARYEELTQTLRTDGYCFDEETYFSAYYDSPWRPGNHRHEVSVPIITICEEELYDELS